MSQKKCFKGFALALVFCIYCLSTNGQITKNRIPSTPVAQIFQQYIDFPVNYSTGLPQIEVPFYTIALKDFSLPISASFHASGRKPSLKFSPLGMNWAIMGSGIINREVRGRPDEENAPHVEAASFDFYPQSDFIDQLMSLDETLSSSAYTGAVTRKDPQYDIYSISAGNISTKFIIKDNGTVVFLTYAPYTLTRAYDWSSFTLTDDKGIVYSFGYTESNSPTSFPKPTSWYLTSIATPGGSTILFKYNRVAVKSGTWLGTTSYQDRIIVKDGDIFNTYSTPPPGGGSSRTKFDGYYNIYDTYAPSNTQSVTGYGMIYLEEIEFDNGKILFNYPDRLNAINNFLLNSCVVKTKSGKVLKSFDLKYYDYLPGTNLRLPNNNSNTIQYIKIKGSNGEEIGKYNFEYYPGTNGGYQQDFEKTKDWWGYCNATNYNSYTKVPFTEIHIEHGAYEERMAQSYNNSTFGGTPNFKIPNFAAKLVGMVKKMTYPTGGFTTFTYEPNKVYYNSSNPNAEGPGIRIQKIVSDDGTGKTLEKAYEYPTGALSIYPSVDDYYKVVRYEFFVKDNMDPLYDPYEKTYLGAYNMRTYSSDPNAEIEAAINYPVMYSYVAEKSIASDGSINGKTIYGYTNPSYHSTSAYTSFSAGAGGTLSFYPRVVYMDEFTQPLLSGKTVQKYNSVTETYTTVSQTSINYTTLNTVNIPQVSIYRPVEFPNDTYGNIQKTLMKSPYHRSFYHFMDRPILTAIQKPQFETTTFFDENGAQLKTVTEYYYDNAGHANPTRIKTTTSEGKETNKYVTYAGDYPSGNNNSSDPIEEVTTSTRNGVTSVVSGAINKYNNRVVVENLSFESNSSIDVNDFKFSNRPSGIIPPSGTASAFVPDSRYVLKSNISYDSKNNPLTVIPRFQPHTSYIWDYDNIYPIAQVANASVTDIAYTSFEADGKGSWVFTGNPILDVTTPTGRKAYSLGSITKNGLSITRTYIVSYWKKSGTVTVNNTTSVTGKTIDDWTYYEHKVINPADGLITVSGTGIIDELRLYPANAQMTTYTYEPLVGMASQCDVNNRIIYYKYDGFQRLMLVRDQDKNIIKKICYNYAGQPESCSAYGNVTKNGTFTKVCETNFIGSSETYIVPANTYYAATQTEADQLAQNDVNTNGQAYANSTGACTIYCSFSSYGVFSIASSYIDKPASTVNFSISFGTTSSSVYWYDANQVATVNGGCKPAITKTFILSENGRTWQVSVNSAGTFSVKLTSGTAPASSTMITLSGSYTP